MTKIAFRHLPFSATQNEQLDDAARAAGYETLWLGGEVPTAAELAGCEVLMGYFPADVLSELPELRWLALPAAGVERFCKPGIFASDEVILTNSSGVFGIDIAEYMVCTTLMLMRHMKRYVAQMATNTWEQAGPARAIYGSRVCVVGTGDIGSEAARRFRALGAAEVRGVNRRGVAPTDDFDVAYPTSELVRAVAGADVVVASLPATQATQGVISAEVIGAMGSQALFVNAGRGSTVDEAALTQALASGAIAGAALDVFEEEPLPATSKLWQLDNVIVTPHVAGWDDDPVNIQTMFELFCDNLARWCAGKPLTHVVDRRQGY